MQPRYSFPASSAGPSTSSKRTRPATRPFWIRRLLIAIALVKGIFLYSQRWILIGISREIELDIRNDLFATWKSKTRASISAIVPAT